MQDESMGEGSRRSSLHPGTSGTQGLASWPTPCTQHAWGRSYIALQQKASARVEARWARRTCQAEGMGWAVTEELAAMRVAVAVAWKEPAEAQMAGRIHRLGQSRQVLIKKFAFRNSIDENIVTLHERIKHGQIAISNGVIPPQGIRLLGRR